MPMVVMDRLGAAMLFLGGLLAFAALMHGALAAFVFAVFLALVILALDRLVFGLLVLFALVVTALHGLVVLHLALMAFLAFALMGFGLALVLSGDALLGAPRLFKLFDVAGVLALGVLMALTNAPGLQHGFLRSMSRLGTVLRSLMAFVASATFQHAVGFRVDLFFLGLAHPTGFHGLGGTSLGVRGMRPIRHGIGALARFPELAFRKRLTVFGCETSHDGFLLQDARPFGSTKRLGQNAQTVNQP